MLRAQAEKDVRPPEALDHRGRCTDVMVAPHQDRSQLPPLPLAAGFPRLSLPCPPLAPSGASAKVAPSIRRSLIVGDQRLNYLTQSENQSTDAR